MTIKKYILICIFLVFLGSAVVYIFLSNSTDTAQPSFLNQNEENVPQPSLPLPVKSAEQQKSELVSDDDAVRGNTNASIVIVEFCDFQYKECAKVNPTIKRVLEAYAGKIKFVYRDFPLSDVHAFAQKAAEAGECAEEQEKYWEYHDKLFEFQQEWAEKGISQLKKYAEELKLDAEKFNSCIDSEKYSKKVLKDINDGKNLGITSIPFFFVNNQTLVGAQTFEDIQSLIEKELNRLKEKQKYGEIEFYSFKKGIEEAKRYNKTVLIYFRSDYCYWCEKFDKEVLTNKSVVDRISENFTPVAVDIDSEKNISSKLNVFGTPTIVFMDISGNELRKLIGFRDAERFLEELNEVLGKM